MLNQKRFTSLNRIFSLIIKKNYWTSNNSSNELVTRSFSALNKKNQPLKEPKKCTDSDFPYASLIEKELKREGKSDQEDTTIISYDKNPEKISDPNDSLDEFSPNYIKKSLKIKFDNDNVIKNNDLNQEKSNFNKINKSHSSGSIKRFDTKIKLLQDLFITSCLNNSDILLNIIKKENIDNNNMDKFFKVVPKIMDNLYGNKLEFPSPKHLYSIIFKELIPIDSELEKHIKSGMISYSISTVENLPKKSSLNSHKGNDLNSHFSDEYLKEFVELNRIIPETSFFLLVTAAIKNKKNIQVLKEKSKAAVQKKSSSKEFLQNVEEEYKEDSYYYFTKLSEILNSDVSLGLPHHNSKDVNVLLNEEILKMYDTINIFFNLKDDLEDVNKSRPFRPYTPFIYTTVPSGKHLNPPIPFKIKSDSKSHEKKEIKDKIKSNTNQFLEQYVVNQNEELFSYCFRHWLKIRFFVLLLNYSRFFPGNTFSTINSYNFLEKLFNINLTSVKFGSVLSDKNLSGELTLEDSKKIKNMFSNDKKDKEVEYENKHEKTNISSSDYYYYNKMKEINKSHSNDVILSSYFNKLDKKKIVKLLNSSHYYFPNVNFSSFSSTSNYSTSSSSASSTSSASSSSPTIQYLLPNYLNYDINLNNLTCLGFNDFLKEINEIKVHELDPIKFMNPIQGECFDYLLLFYSSELGPVSFFFSTSFTSSHFHRHPLVETLSTMKLNIENENADDDELESRILKKLFINHDNDEETKSNEAPKKSSHQIRENRYQQFQNLIKYIQNLDEDKYQKIIHENSDEFTNNVFVNSPSSSIDHFSTEETPCPSIDRVDPLATKTKPKSTSHASKLRSVNKNGSIIESIRNRNYLYVHFNEDILNYPEYNNDGLSIHFNKENFNDFFCTISNFMLDLRK